MSTQAEIRVLGLYPGNFDLGQVQPLGNAGGFSGAMLWRIQREDKTFCLRRWPSEHPTPNRLSFIHRVLQHVAAAGIAFIPAPLQALSGETFVQLEGHLWELSRWLPGEADYVRWPSREKLGAALESLARFHAAAKPLGDPRPSRSRGIAERHARLTALLKGGVNRIKFALDRSPRTELSLVGRRIVELFALHAPRCLTSISQASQQTVHQQPCIRDVWHDHILYVENRVTGIVDFGAMRNETVAADIARLLGSLAKDEANQWRIGIEAYESVRPLGHIERGLIRAFDESTVLLSGMNWLEWIYIEGRQFDALERILQRLSETLARLEHLKDHSVSNGPLWKQ